jgi:hypothetical protein
MDVNMGAADAPRAAILPPEPWTGVWWDAVRWDDAVWWDAVRRMLVSRTTGVWSTGTDDMSDAVAAGLDGHIATRDICRDARARRVMGSGEVQRVPLCAVIYDLQPR